MGGRVAAHKTVKFIAVPALAAAGVLWGVSFLFGKWALEEMGPAHVTFLRFVVASAALLPWALWRGVRPERRDLALFLLVGFLTVPATFLVQFWGLSMTSASAAALIVGCGPAQCAGRSCTCRIRRCSDALCPARNL